MNRVKIPDSISTFATIGGIYCDSVEVWFDLTRADPESRTDMAVEACAVFNEDEMACSILDMTDGPDGELQELESRLLTYCAKLIGDEHE
jgi:hypothetical protein